MKIRTYIAKDMRQALRLVREEQGPDAVILSTQRTSEGVEVTAAVDHDNGAHASASVAAPVAATPPLPQRSVAAAVAEVAAPSMSGLHEPVNEMNSELKRLRQMLETQVATLAWNDLTRRAPVQAELLRDLTQLGLAPDLAAELAAQTPSHLEFAEAHRLALAQISRRIDVLGDRYLDEGGLYAFVGPTGVGKTTALAKLAARWVLRHGPRDVALISADSIRIGAQEQIHTLARLLGVPAYAVDSTAELKELLHKLGNRRLVLVDTAGLSPKDERSIAELNGLADAHPALKSILVLNTSAQAGSLEDAYTRYAAARPVSCVLTKIDEAMTLGGTLSLLIRTRLPVSYVSEGQRVPEDLTPARAHQLVARAVDLARRAGASADEDLLRRRFGAVAHALA